MALTLSGSVARTRRFSSLRPTPGGPGDRGDGQDQDDHDDLDDHADHDDHDDADDHADHADHDDNSPMRMIGLYLPVLGNRRATSS